MCNVKSCSSTSYSAGSCKTGNCQSKASSSNNNALLNQDLFSFPSIDSNQNLQQGSFASMLQELLRMLLSMYGSGQNQGSSVQNNPCQQKSSGCQGGNCGTPKTDCSNGKCQTVSNIVGKVASSLKNLQIGQKCHYKLDGCPKDRYGTVGSDGKIHTMEKDRSGNMVERLYDGVKRGFSLLETV